MQYNEIWQLIVIFCCLQIMLKLMMGQWQCVEMRQKGSALAPCASIITSPFCRNSLSRLRTTTITGQGQVMTFTFSRWYVCGSYYTPFFLQFSFLTWTTPVLVVYTHLQMKDLNRTRTTSTSMHYGNWSCDCQIGHMTRNAIVTGHVTLGDGHVTVWVSLACATCSLLSWPT